MRELSRRVLVLEKAFAAAQPARRHDMSGLSDRALELIERAADWCMASANGGNEAALEHLDRLFAEAGLRLSSFDRDDVLVWQDSPAEWSAGEPLVASPGGL